MPERRSTTTQMALPGVLDLVRGGKRIAISNRRIPHKKILEAFLETESGSEDLVGIYRERVLPIKTRTIQLLGRKGIARIMKTLLGYEVQASYKRIQCPDLVTARYLKLFSELGCRSIRLPYDPTVTAALIPRFEATMQELNSGVRVLFPRNKTIQLYVIRQIYRIIRARLQARPAPESRPLVELPEE
jgi:hypothetical protein